jgi:hypothetical protein
VGLRPARGEALEEGTRAAQRRRLVRCAFCRSGELSVDEATRALSYLAPDISYSDRLQHSARVRRPVPTTDLANPSAHLWCLTLRTAARLLSARAQ